MKSNIVSLYCIFLFRYYLPHSFRAASFQAWDMEYFLIERSSHDISTFAKKKRLIIPKCASVDADNECPSITADLQFPSVIFGGIH